MNKILIVASTAVIATSVSIAATAHRYNQDLYGRFPELDRKIVRKAYRKFLKNAMDGTYGYRGDMDAMTDEEMDVLFLEVYHTMTY